MRMPISKFFQYTLCAKFKNDRWSWGAVDRGNRRVFLRVWKHQIENGRVLVASEEWDRKGPGYKERVRHIGDIEKGFEGFGVVCTAVDTTAKKSECRIKSYEDGYLLRFGDITQGNGHHFANIVERVPPDAITHSALARDLTTIVRNKSLEFTTKEALVNARVGQGSFRTNVLELWDGKCSVTGSSTQKAIRASHIKPWRDSTDEERLDPNNGLPLVASLDALFDACLISFDESGRMIVSSTLPQPERDIFGVDGMCLIKTPTDETAGYLLHHRTEFLTRETEAVACPA